LNCCYRKFVLGNRLNILDVECVDLSDFVCPKGDMHAFLFHLQDERLYLSI